VRGLIEGYGDEWGHDGRNLRALIEGCREEWGSDGWTVRGLIEGCGEEWGRDGRDVRERSGECVGAKAGGDGRDVEMAIAGMGAHDGGWGRRRIKAFVCGR
jgi:hypothetical protein